MQTTKDIQITEEIWAGQDSFIICTHSTCYVYHKEGCGFASLIDRDKKDWISYKPTGGEYGHYRGIPNMGFESFGHPGYAFSAKSRVLISEPDHIRIASHSVDKQWACDWDIFPEFALHTVVKTPQPYWWLYEGTPDGHLRPDQQHLMLSSGEIYPCSAAFEIKVSAQRWVCFVNNDKSRGLLLVSHSTEPSIDCYWQMGGEGGMTVFGFGRTDNPLIAHLTAPAQYSVSLIENVNPTAIEQRLIQIDRQRSLLSPV